MNRGHPQPSNQPPQSQQLHHQQQQSQPAVGTDQDRNRDIQNEQALWALLSQQNNGTSAPNQNFQPSSLGQWPRTGSPSTIQDPYASAHNYQQYPQQHTQYNHPMPYDQGQFGYVAQPRGSMQSMNAQIAQNPAYAQPPSMGARPQSSSSLHSQYQNARAQQQQQLQQQQQQRSASPAATLARPAQQTSAAPAVKPENSLLRNSARYLSADMVDPSERQTPKVKSAIPTNISLTQYAEECLAAASACRLPPYETNAEEEAMIKNHVSSRQQSTLVAYVQARNAICHLWNRNPLLYVTRVEAQGVAKEERFFAIAGLAWDYLSRNGYINFGCLNIPPFVTPARLEKNPRKTIVVIGAGMAGLGCARQLEGLLRQHGHHFTINNEPPPRIVVLDSRKRIGGRVYSHQLKSESERPDTKDKTPYGRVDLGAQIITGFDFGNPMSVLLKRQLALPYHSLRDPNLTYDVDGSRVDTDTDQRVHALWNDVLDRASSFKENKQAPMEGAEAGAAVDRLTGRPANANGASTNIPPSQAIKSFGFTLRNDVGTNGYMEPVLEEGISLGDTITKTLHSFEGIAKWTPLEVRLLEWHMANLEYANGTTLDSLSLTHWDQDDGNEFRGAHATVKGGYAQVARGLALAPSKLDLQLGKAVREITYSEEGESSTVVLQDNTTIEADAIVSTLPLGIMKTNNVQFTPALPDWKNSAIQALGFGLMNKIVLAFDQEFWDPDVDFINVLAAPNGDESQFESYEISRGRFYQFWNCSRTAGRPVLTAFMAGEAAKLMESEPDNALIEEAVGSLRKIYPDASVPAPIETVVTRWGRDSHCLGSYSYVGIEASGNDYDALARPIGNLFFAGEATCRTHPATVHGAYISGIRAAREVLEHFVGPIPVPDPLVPKSVGPTSSYTQGTKRKGNDSDEDYEGMSHRTRYRILKQERTDGQREAIEAAILERLGERPALPQRPSANPFLLYQKMEWHQCKARVEQDKLRQGDPSPKATKNEIRARLGREWREMEDAGKKPWIDEITSRRAEYYKQLDEVEAMIRDHSARADAIRNDMQADFDALPIPENERAEELLAKEEEENAAKIKALRDQEEFDEASDEDEYQEDDYKDF